MARNSILLLAALALTGTACGGDEGGGGLSPEEKKKKEEMAKKKKAAADKKKKVKKKLDVITHIAVLEQKVACRQGTQLRHKLKDRDFASIENRNPFFSTFLPAEGAADTQVGNAGPIPIVKPTKECGPEDLVAKTTNFALRDLTLIGIIRRGNQRYAMFRDTKGEGHVVGRGKCIGREKARVIEIAEELVDIEITPEEGTTTGAPGETLVPQRISIPLYPEAIVSDTAGEVTTPEVVPASETTPSAPPAPPPSGS